MFSSATKTDHRSIVRPLREIHFTRICLRKQHFCSRTTVKYVCVSLSLSLTHTHTLSGQDNIAWPRTIPNRAKTTCGKGPARTQSVPLLCSRRPGGWLHFWGGCIRPKWSESRTTSAAVVKPFVRRCRWHLHRNSTPFPTHLPLLLGLLCLACFPTPTEWMETFQFKH